VLSLQFLLQYVNELLVAYCN